MKYLAVKNFGEFQHYKKRRPVWIKFYAATLSDYAFVQLPDAARAHLMLIWQLAAALGNRIPHDAKYIAQEIRASGKVDLDRLIEAGFLVVLDESANRASNVIAEVENVDSLEGEREKEREKDSSSPDGDRESDVAALLPTNADRNALTALLVRVPYAETWLSEMRACLQNMSGHISLTPTQLGQALRDFVANGAATQPNMRHFRSYLESAGRPSKRAAGGASPPAMGTGGRAFLTTLAAIEDLP